MANSLDEIKPEILNKGLPQQVPYGVLEWGFVLKTAQASFVKVDEFNLQPGDHYLRAPVVLGVRTDTDAAQGEVLPEQAGIFSMDDVDGNTICHVHLRRDVGDVWKAQLMQGARAIGSAKGTVGRATPFQIIEAGLAALGRHVAAKNNPPA